MGVYSWTSQSDTFETVNDTSLWARSYDLIKALIRINPLSGEVTKCYAASSPEARHCVGPNAVQASSIARFDHVLVLLCATNTGPSSTYSHLPFERS